MAGDFDRHWDSAKKHRKRNEYWLPMARDIKNGLPEGIEFKYLTFCARSMIDVFHLALKGVLSHDIDFNSIKGVTFCENELSDFEEITSILGDVSSGFPFKFERLILFQDDNETQCYQTVKEIEKLFEDEGPDLPSNLRNKLKLKKAHLEFVQTFPFDFINLDFCSYYYPQPPEITLINEAVKKALLLQKDSSKERFLLSVTCKFDNNLSTEVFARLEEIIRKNCNEHDEYANSLRESHKPNDPHLWREQNQFDFFMSAWPKELLTVSKQTGWQMEIKNLVHYYRGSGSHLYRIVCLIAKFEKMANEVFYITESIKAVSLRDFIQRIAPTSADAATLLADLNATVYVRNKRAKNLGLPGLPPPHFKDSD